MPGGGNGVVRLVVVGCTGCRRVVGFDWLIVFDTRAPSSDDVDAAAAEDEASRLAASRGMPPPWWCSAQSAQLLAAVFTQRGMAAWRSANVVGVDQPG